jgi:hypothetical protein
MTESLYKKIQNYQHAQGTFSTVPAQLAVNNSVNCSYRIYKNRLAQHVLETISNRKQQALNDATDDLFQDRFRLIRSKLELIILQLAERKKINRKILYQIDQDACRAQSLYFDMGFKGYELSKEKLALEKMKFDLERQRRAEQSTYFNDTALLNRELKDTLIEYLDEFQKNQLLTVEDAL